MAFEGNGNYLFLREFYSKRQHRQVKTTQVAVHLVNTSRDAAITELFEILRVTKSSNRHRARGSWFPTRYHIANMVVCPIRISSLWGRDRCFSRRARGSPIRYLPGTGRWHPCFGVKPSLDTGPAMDKLEKIALLESSEFRLLHLPDKAVIAKTNNTKPKPSAMVVKALESRQPDLNRISERLIAKPAGTHFDAKTANRKGIVTGRPSISEMA